MKELYGLGISKLQVMKMETMANKACSIVLLVGITVSLSDGLFETGNLFEFKIFVMVVIH